MIPFKKSKGRFGEVKLILKSLKIKRSHETVRSFYFGYHDHFSPTTRNKMKFMLNKLNHPSRCHFRCQTCHFVVIVRLYGKLAVSCNHRLFHNFIFNEVFFQIFIWRGWTRRRLDFSLRFFFELAQIFFNDNLVLEFLVL